MTVHVRGLPYNNIGDLYQYEDIDNRGFVSVSVASPLLSTYEVAYNGNVANQGDLAADNATLQIVVKFQLY